MTKKDEALLRRLIKHLRKGELIHDEFNYNFYNLPDSGKLDKFVTKFKGRRAINFCGTSGCAVGELPAISKHFMFDSVYKSHVCYFGGKKITVRNSDKTKVVYHLVDKEVDTVHGDMILGLPDGVFRIMFIPSVSYRVLNGLTTFAIGTSPHYSATRYEVANHIENILNYIVNGYSVI